MAKVSAGVLFTPIPERIERLQDLAYNLWWTWHNEAQELYRQIDPALWELVYHNPVDFLREVRQHTLETAAANPAYLQQYDAVLGAFDAYMGEKSTWFTRHYPDMQNETIAYFSAEFGLHESLPIYSGGLGILSGDHTKEASDMGLPFVGVGFIYPQGYFRQRLDHSGWQFAEYNKLNFSDVSATPALTPDGKEVVIEVELPGRTIYAKVYRFQNGRNPLYLMDTDIHPNSPRDRELSARLYGGDQEMRISQEIVLGIGGVRALRKLGINPTVWHMNEGHSAFLVLELLREKLQAGVPYEEAVRDIQARSIFTTHTPVPAGNDAFPFQLMEQFFAQYWPQLGLSQEDFLNLARQDQHWGPTFAMTVLAIRFANRRNGVSKLHGHVARGMWNWLFPDKSQDEVPITSVTNGVHTGTWLAPELRKLYDEYLPANWFDTIDEGKTWEPIRTIPDKKFWDTKQQLKSNLVGFVRERTQARLQRMGQHAFVSSLLDEKALTIGFARRFATYKRATLLFRDLERLKTLLNMPGRPVQVVFSGKAHPADDPGKHFIQDVFQLSMQPGLAGKIIFIEEYDICVGQKLVQGVDVWLNNPRRPHEASGTSGQKASLNGAPNLSVLDGWWPEAFNGKNGWKIGDEREYHNYDEQDWLDSQDLYHTLETQVIPAYYDQDADGISSRWVEICKEAIITCAPQFSMRRMIADYTNELYIPAAREGKSL